MTRPALSRTRLIQKIHVAKRQLGLEEADYRAVLSSATGKDSAGAMSDVELQTALTAFEALGFQSSFKGAPDGKKSARPVVRLIFGLWTDLGRRGLIDTPDRKALFAFVKRMTDVDHPDWLDNAQANKIVEALKAIRDRGRASGPKSGPRFSGGEDAQEGNPEGASA